MPQPKGKKTEVIASPEHDRRQRRKFTPEEREPSTGLVAYCFTETWKAEDVAPYFQLIGNDTYVQVDGYAGYNTLVEGPDGRKIPVVAPDRRLGCMMHVRRNFYVGHGSRSTLMSWFISTKRSIF